MTTPAIQQLQHLPPPSLGSVLRDTGERKRRLAAAAILAIFGLFLYGDVLWGLIQDWWNIPDYSHGFLVPAFSAYVLWRERERFLALELAPANSGIAVMLAAVGLLVGGTAGAELFTSRVSFIVLLAGMVVLFAGWKAARALALPLGYLLLMIPIPVLIQNQAVFPMQLLASRFAAAVLQGLGLIVLREGNVLNLANTSIEIVQACSGLRSLTALAALAIAYGYLLRRPVWRRWMLVFLVVPVAILSNGLRIVVTGLMAQFLGPAWAEGSSHEIAGLLVMAFALCLLMAADGALGRARPSRKNVAGSSGEN